MATKQDMIHSYIRSQFIMSTIQVTFYGTDRVQISDRNGDTLMLTCDERFNIIDVASGEIIAKPVNTAARWQNIPGSFWK